MPLTEETYRQLALEDPEGQWELDCGRLRGKPAMTFEHNYLAGELQADLIEQLDRRTYHVSPNRARLRISAERYYIPDVCVIPLELLLPHRGRTDALEVYPDPLPLVAEVWSPSTGAYDVEIKLAEYQRRGDLEIWRIHPYEHTLITWRRQPDGAYTQSHYTGGPIQPVALPGVTIDLDSLFA
jgi:Uma2 family endonuclease